MPLLFVELYLFGQLADLAVHPHPHEPFPSRVVQDADVLTLHVRDHRRKQQDARAVTEPGDRVDDLLDRLA